MKLAPFALALALTTACTPTVESNDDCEAWRDSCNGCAAVCTPKWDVPESQCELACEDTDPMPSCEASDGECRFAQ